MIVTELSLSVSALMLLDDRFDQVRTKFILRSAMLFDMQWCSYVRAYIAYLGPGLGIGMISHIS